MQTKRLWIPCISFEKLEEKNPLSQYVNKLEEDIKVHPSFWLWSHKRWKGA